MWRKEVFVGAENSRSSGKCCLAHRIFHFLSVIESIEISLEELGYDMSSKMGHLIDPVVIAFLNLLFVCFFRGCFIFHLTFLFVIKLIYIFILMCGKKRYSIYVAFIK